MNTERIEEIQKETAYPQSQSVQQALLNVWNETAQKYKTELEAKDERIAELEAMVEKMKCCENCEYYPPSKCGKSVQYGCSDDGYDDWRLKKCMNK